MRLAVTNDWADPKSAVFWNKDGFLKMLQVLKERDGWEVVFFKKSDRSFSWPHDCVDIRFSPNPAQAVRDFKPDAILYFSDLSRPIIEELNDYPCPKAICYSGGRFTNYERMVDLIFVESKTYVKWFAERGIKAIQAFGTNTELFKPYNQPKFFDAFFPATFASWKRHHLFAEAMGDKGLLCGWWQPNEMIIIEKAFKCRTGVLHHQIAESIALLYSMAKVVLVTSHDTGGSQRTVLEAMACNIPLVVMSDSTMTSEYVREAGEGMICEPNVEDIRKAVEIMKDKKVNTREWIMKNYSEYVYADKVRDGILSLCQK